MIKYTIGVDVGGTNIKLGLVQDSGKVVRRSHISTKKFLATKKTLIKAIMASIRALIEEEGLKKSQIRGVGMGLPGLIDSAKGLVITLPNVPGWRNVKLKAIMEKELKVPVFIDNDVNVITLAEWQYGAGKGYNNFVCMTIGTGVGGGLILDGKLYRGEGFVAGEIGFMPLNDKILEGYVGNTVLINKARKLFKNKTFSLEDVAQLAHEGNITALKFWQEAGEYLGTTLAGVINLLNPRLIIIGGGVSHNFKFFKDSLQQTINQRAMQVQSKMVKIVRAKLSDDAGIIGGQILLKESKLGRF